MANKHPSRDECLALLNKYHTPKHVVQHCIEVTKTATRIGKALNDKGFQLDLGLIEASGLIHDIARVEDKHWEVGAKIASDLGYFQEAEIIKVHMFYHSDPNKATIEEIDILCLSDKMVKEDKYVGLDSRMQYVLERFKGNYEALERINASIKDNKFLIERIENQIGVTIDTLML